MILKKWVMRQGVSCSPADSEKGLSVIERLMKARGVDTPEKIANFRGEGFLSNPFSLLDMDKAVNRVMEAVSNEEPILIFGDYDADGVCATAILWHYLHTIGARVSFYLPDREKEGYGLNANLVKSAAKRGIMLLLTVDNGIACHNEIALATSLGMDTVVLDHHQPSETLPDAFAVVDAHRADQTENAENLRLLCGAAIALLFVAAMEEGDTETAMDQYAHLAAIATIGDMMTLQGDSRLIVQRGIENLRYTDEAGLLAMMQVSNLAPENIGAEQIAFTLVPRINAAGRMSSATEALKLLLEDDPEKALADAAKISKHNDERRREESAIMAEIEAAIAMDPSLLAGRVGFFYGEDWHKGVVGIVAARLMQKYGKPTFVISVHDDEAVGSGRSFGAFSVFDALTAAAPVLSKFGGHQGAGGFSCSTADLSTLRHLLEKFAKEQFPAMPLPESEIDLLPDVTEITTETARSLSLLEPVGQGNPAPVFLMEGLTIRHVSPLKEGRYVRFEGIKEGFTFSFLNFFTPFDAFPFRTGDKVDLLYTMSVNSYMGRESVSCKCLEIRPSALPFAAYHLGLALFERFGRGEEITKSEAEKALPSQEDMREIWLTLSRLTPQTREAETLFFRLFEKRIGYAKIRFALRMMEELGLISWDEQGLIVPAESVGKVDFRTTDTYQALFAAAR